MKRTVGWFAAVMILLTARGVQAQPPRRALAGVRHFERLTGMTRGDRFDVSFDAFDRRFELELEPSTPFATDAKIIWIGDGVDSEETPSTTGYFAGRLKGEPGSRVRVRWHAGALDGVIITPADTYFVQPDGRGPAAEATVMFRRQDVQVDGGHARCGTDAPVAEAAAVVAPAKTIRPALAFTAAADDTLRRAEINLVADYQFYQMNGADSAQVMQDIISQVSAIYEAEIGVTLSIARTVIYTSRNDPFSETTDPGSLLEEFSDYVGAADSPVSGGDVAHLFTGRDLDGGVVGIAWIGSLCDHTYGTGLSQDLGGSAMVNLVAHEIGHNFAALHDALTCSHPPVGYIMQPNLSCVSASQFSSQSLNDIANYLSTVSCLDGGAAGAPPSTATRTPTPAGTRTPTRTRTPTPTGPTPTASETPLFSPARVAGLALWLDAGGIEAASDGAAVAMWPDLSGRAHDAVQPAPDSQPQYRASALNGAAAVRFDGTNDSLSIDAALVSGKQKRTVLIVGRPDIVGSRGFIDLGNAATPGAAFMITPEYAVSTGSGQRMWVPGASTTVPAITTIRLNGSSTANLAAWVNGKRLKVAGSKTARINTAGGVTIGGGTAGSGKGTRAFAGDIAEILVYDRGLSTRERVQLEEYLSRKYAIALMR